MTSMELMLAAPGAADHAGCMPSLAPSNPFITPTNHRVPTDSEFMSVFQRNCDYLMNMASTPVKAVHNGADYNLSS